SFEEALAKTVTLAKKLEHWCKALEPGDAQPKKNLITIGRLPASVRKKLANARQALSELCQAIEAEQQPQRPAKAKAKPRAVAPRPKLFPGRSPLLSGGK